MYFSPRLAGLKAPRSLAAPSSVPGGGAACRVMASGRARCLGMALRVKAEGTASKRYSPGPGQRKGPAPFLTVRMGLRKERRLQGKQHERSWSSAHFQPKEPKRETIQLKFALAFGGFLTEKPKRPSLLHARSRTMTFKANPTRQHFPASGTHSCGLQNAALSALPKRAAKAERLFLRCGGTTISLCRMLSRNSSVRGVPLPPAGTTPPQERPSSGPVVTRALPDGNGMPTKCALNFSLHLLVRLPKVLNNKSAYFQT